MTDFMYNLSLATIMTQAKYKLSELDVYPESMSVILKGDVVEGEITAGDYLTFAFYRSCDITQEKIIQVTDSQNTVQIKLRLPDERAVDAVRMILLEGETYTIINQQTESPTNRDS